MRLALLRIWRAPAVRAALAQALAAPLTLALVFALARAGLVPGYLAAAVIQGALAALLAWRLRLARWWWLIDCLFPVLVLFAHRVPLSPGLYLGCFLFMLVLYWSTFRTQVPYFPSRRSVWREVERLLPADRPVALVDIGSGLGGLVLYLAARFPQGAFSGIELAPLPWLVSRMRALGAKGHVRFLRGDYETLDFSQFDVVFAYLSPAVMSALGRRAAATMRPGSMLLSYEFVIEEMPPVLTILPTGGGPPLHVWHF